jgi:hypothetical protein
LLSKADSRFLRQERRIEHKTGIHEINSKVAGLGNTWCAGHSLNRSSDLLQFCDFRRERQTRHSVHEDDLIVPSSNGALELFHGSPSRLT